MGRLLPDIYTIFRQLTGETLCNGEREQSFREKVPVIFFWKNLFETFKKGFVCVVKILANSDKCFQIIGGCNFQMENKQTKRQSKFELTQNIKRFLSQDFILSKLKLFSFHF